MKYSDPAPGWTTELIATFVLGFILATLLWVGLWFFKTKPDYATAVHARETALRECVAARKDCDGLRSNAAAENENIRKQLEETKSAWSRCLKSKKELESKRESEQNAQP